MKIQLNKAQKKILSILSIAYLSTFSLVFYTPEKPQAFVSLEYSLQQKNKCSLDNNQNLFIDEVKELIVLGKEQKIKLLVCEKPFIRPIKSITTRARPKTINSCPSLNTIRNKLLTKLGIKAIPKIKINKQVTIAVIDTGLNINIPEFHNRLYLPRNLVKDKNGYGIDYSTDDLSFKPVDIHGHGSHVSGIILSIFPEAKILPIKYYNPKNSGQKNLEAMNKSLAAAIEANVDIINISGGGPEASQEELALMQKAKDLGIIVVLAAGNDYSNVDADLTENRVGFKYYPASYDLDNMISVMNMIDSSSFHRSSNFGRKTVHLGTMGTSIFSYGSASEPKCSMKMTGTSQATPIVTATVAMIKAEYPHLSYQEIKEQVLKTTQYNEILQDKNATSGLLDIERALANETQKAIH